MKLDEAIKTIDQQKPNAYTRQEKIAWINQLDGIIKAEVIDTHEGAEDVTFSPYTDDDGSKELLVPFPYDSIYLHWLEAKIDYANAEYAKYNNSMAMYDTFSVGFRRFYNRQRRPIASSVSGGFVYY